MRVSAFLNPYVPVVYACVHAVYTPVQLLNADPAARLGSTGVGDAEAVKSHPFFKDINWQALDLRQAESPDWVDEMLQVFARS